jgi:hypothetical protein
MMVNDFYLGNLDIARLNYGVIMLVPKVNVDAKRAPSAKHTASRTSWLYTRRESRDVPVNFS